MIYNHISKAKDQGADIIIGHHPHILNPSEWHKTHDGRDTVCFYSLGSITTTAMPWVAQNTSQIAGITLEKGISANGKKAVRIKDVSLTPAFFMRRGRGKKREYYLFFQLYMI
jgi:poly-gamma-glutamate capsule biosynthesis protein CapA/YwtB (metallophosphatase superfamily)